MFRRFCDAVTARILSTGPLLVGKGRFGRCFSITSTSTAAETRKIWSAPVSEFVNCSSPLAPKSLLGPRASTELTDGVREIRRGRRGTFLSAVSVSRRQTDCWHSTSRNRRMRLRRHSRRVRARARRRASACWGASHRSCLGGDEADDGRMTALALEQQANGAHSGTAWLDVFVLVRSTKS